MFFLYERCFEGFNFCLRLLWDILPTKSNLVNRDIIFTEASFCMAGCGHVENAQHLFLSCGTFGSLWHQLRPWIDIPRVDPQVIPDHFIQLIYVSGGLKTRCSFLQLVYLLCAWLVWNERNNIIKKYRILHSSVTG